MTIQNSQQEHNATHMPMRGTDEMNAGRSTSRLTDFQYADDALDAMPPGWSRIQHRLLRYIRTLLHALAARIADYFARRSPFSWRERNWRQNVTSSMRNLPGRIAAILVGIVAVLVALTIASQSSILADLHLPRPGEADSNVSNPVVLHQDLAPNATPVAPAYLVGMWTTTPNPAASGSVKVYVRVSRNTAPVPHASVSLKVQGGRGSTTLGPYYTNSYGLATFTVGYSGLSSNSPILLIAHASIGGKTYTAEISLVN